ncbi:hypothetical protein BS78_10G005800 [Paspalum vaginatum]|nr:hypothetical protein BS78_10G005800 [Paspalum vaginatum]
MTSSALVLLLLLCLCCVMMVATSSKGKASSSPDDLVAKACEDATGDDSAARRFGGPGLSLESCESALRSDNRSAAAEQPRDLAIVAMDLLERAAAAAESKIGGAFPSSSPTKWGRSARLIFQYCLVDYEAMASTIPPCRARIQEYDPIDDDGGGFAGMYYFECVDRLRDWAVDCWTELYYADIGFGAREVMWKEAVQATRLANLAKAMVEQMLDEYDMDDRLAM